MHAREVVPEVVRVAPLALALVLDEVQVELANRVDVDLASVDVGTL